jgi:hypothetical protein
VRAAGSSGEHVIHHVAGTCTSTSGLPAWLAILIAAILLAAAIVAVIQSARPVTGPAASPKMH